MCHPQSARCPTCASTSKRQQPQVSCLACGAIWPKSLDGSLHELTLVETLVARHWQSTLDAWCRLSAAPLSSLFHALPRRKRGRMARRKAAMLLNIASSRCVHCMHPHATWSCASTGINGGCRSAWNGRSSGLLRWTPIFTAESTLRPVQPVQTAYSWAGWTVCDVLHPCCMKQAVAKAFGPHWTGRGAAIAHTAYQVRTGR